YTFTPAQDYHGDVPVVSYTVTDGVTTDDSTLSISVTSVIDGFSDANEVVSTPEDTPLDGSVVTGTSSGDGSPITVTTFTVAGDGHTYNAGDTAAIDGVGSPTLHTADLYTFTPAQDYHGDVPVVSYTVTDGVTTDDSTLTITVTSVIDG